MNGSTLCRCEQCELLRSKGIKSKFTPQECKEIREYAKRMMREVRKRRRKQAWLNGLVITPSPVRRWLLAARMSQQPLRYAAKAGPQPFGELHEH